MLSTKLIENKKNIRNKKFTRPTIFEILKEEMDISETIFNLPEQAFMIKVSGDSMNGIGINSGDTLFVDRQRKYKHGDIVVAAVNKKLAVKRLNYSYKETMLISENDNYIPIRIREGDKLDIWGVVTLVIKESK